MRTGAARRLPPAFYRRRTRRVARELLGQRLVRLYKGRRLAGRIVETEAYLGVKDAAAHTYKGLRTERNEAMWLPGGRSYVYFVYGMHHCLNVVTRGPGEPEAVLIRALEPVEGLAAMRRLRGARPDRELANGPGKLCAALAIDRGLNAEPLGGPRLFIERDRRVPDREVARGPRVGVDYAGKAARWPLRYFVKGHPCVSKAPTGR